MEHPEAPSHEYERQARVLERLLAEEDGITKLDIAVYFGIRENELEGNPRTTVNELAEKCGVTDRSIRRSLNRLQAVDALRVIHRTGRVSAYQTVPVVPLNTPLESAYGPKRPPPPPSSKVVMEEANASSMRRAAPRRKDELFEALCKVGGHELGSLTKAERGRLNRARKELADVGATAEDVFERTEQYRKMHPDWIFTPMALVTHWSTLKPKEAQSIDDYATCQCGHARWEHDERLNNGIDHPFAAGNGAQVGEDAIGAPKQGLGRR